ncbi:MAG TPA: BREX system ATP-binding domain-containing protein, partial [Actinomycetospora sp.]|nr:BREX system ATP-binding domain-containing protein [Actinomycetospora sp.]
MGQARCPLLVGRDEELDTLRRAVDRAAAGQGGCVLVTGEAGVGKSRLLTTVVEAASSSGTVVLRGQAVPSPAPAPYRPLIEAFTSGLRGRPPPSGGPASAGLAPALELLVPAWRTDPAADRAEPSVVLVGEAALTLLDVADVGHGVLVALDDLQGADPETLGVLDYLVRQIADRPVLIVATARHGEVDGADRWVRSLADRRAARVLEPARLSDEEVAAMVTACLAPPTPAAEVVTMLARRAGGLPLLVEDLLTTLLEAGSLTLDGDRWAVCGEVRSVVPSSFATSVADRVAALPAPVRRVVEAAAVVGERFDWRTVAA